MNAIKIQSETKKFLEQNPTIKKALKIFNISYDRYLKATAKSYKVYTSSSANR